LSALIAFAVSLARPARAEPAQPIAPAFDKLDRSGTPKATFDANNYGVVHVETTSLWSKSTWWRPVRGVYRFPTNYGDFYRALGRPELADQEETRHATSQWLFWGGLVLMLGGLMGGSYSLYKERKVGAIIGAGFFVGGFITLKVGGAMSRPTLPESAAEEMAERYNRALGQHLGLSAAGDF
jgi:hypothetical protein